MRLVSLVPSLTELLCHLGLKQDLVGRTKFCIHPSDIKQVAKVGGTKTVDTDKVIELRPDLIIANKEENVKEQVERLQECYNVHVTDISTVDEALESIQTIGVLTDKDIEASTLVEQIEAKRNVLRTLPKTPPKVAYVIWRKPFMTVGGDTFIHSMLQESGYGNIFGSKDRYPEFTLENLVERNPDFVFLSSEPFPFKQKHIDEISNHFPKERILLVDGEYFSWYGSRMLGAFDYFQRLRTITDGISLQ